MGNLILDTSALSLKLEGKTIVDNVNIHILKGSIYALLGKNGAGKTSLLRMIMGLVKPSFGDIRIFDKDIKSDSKQIYQRIGSLIGVPGFYKNLTGRENLNILAHLRGIHRQDAVEYAISRVGLSDGANRVVSRYSLGMKQRLGIAAAIMHEPELLILDEPINYLDPVGIQEIRNLLIRLRDEKKVTILITSHILREVELLADYIGVLNESKLLSEVSCNEFRNRNRKFMEFQVSNTGKAALILEEQFKISDYEVQDNSLIKVFSNVGEQGCINKAFVDNCIEVTRITTNEDTLEDYFIRLIGGRTDD